MIKIGTASMTINTNEAKGPMIFKNSVSNGTATSSALQGAASGTSVASGSKKTPDPQTSRARWCPAGLTHSQKRKLQRLRAKEQREQEAREREAERVFNETHPMFPQKKQQAPP